MSRERHTGSATCTTTTYALMVAGIGVGAKVQEVLEALELGRRPAVEQRANGSRLGLPSIEQRGA